MFATEATAIGFADDDARRACDAMRRDIETVLSDTRTRDGSRIANEAMRAFERSLVRRDRASWQAFFVALCGIVARSDDLEGDRGRAARAHLQAFLDENRDLEDE